MSHKKYLLIATIFCLTHSLSATDINDTKKIIEDASKATKQLQKDFLQLLENKKLTQEENIIDITDDNITIYKEFTIEGNLSSEENTTTKDKK